MRFTAIQLRSHDVRLDDLSPGMNVIYVPAAEQRRLLPAAIRAAIFGTVADELPDCRLALQTNWGGFHLEYRGHDGTVQATDSQGNHRSDWLQQKLATLTTEAAFSAVYTPRWADPVALDTLACVLCGDGLSGKRMAAFETLLRELENTRSWRERDLQLERLRARQAQLEGQLAQAREVQPAPVPAAVPALDQRIGKWQQKLARCQKTIQGIKQRLKAQQSAAAHERSVAALRKRVRSIQRHIQRLVLVLRDLRDRSCNLRVRIGLDPAHPIAATTSPTKKRRRLLQKYQKMMRCQTVLSEQVAALLARRQRLQMRLEKAVPTAVSQAAARRMTHELRRWEQREARCRAQLKLLEQQRTAMRAPTGRPDEKNNPLRQLRSELSQVRTRLARWTTEEQREAHRLLERLRTFFAERRNPAVLNDAAAVLRQLTEGALTGIRAGNHGRELIVEHADGRSVSCDVLSRAERVQVQLGLCLAAAASAAHRGANFPVILNDVTRHIQPGRLRTAVELLRNHGRAAGQVILLTSQSHVATLCRSLGASSYSLEPQEVPSTVRFASPATTAIRDVPIKETTWDCEEFPGELRDRMRASREREAIWSQAQAAHAGFTTANGSAHHHHDLGAEPAETMHAESGTDETLRPSGFYLELCDRVTEIPFLARRVAQAVEREGVFTVANLLHADAGQLASRLAEHDVTSTMIRDWQSQAALMCTVRRLRGYDAKILTACGIATAEQLADIQPHELYNMIQAFVATPEGSRVVRSGADHEVARLTQWIRSLQRSRQKTASPKHRRREAVASTNGRAKHSIVYNDAAEANSPAPSQPARELSPEPKPAKHSGKKPSKKSPERNPKRTADVIPMRFHLDVTSHVEAAPSIGPTMAKRLEKIGITTVGELLTATPEDVARQLKSQRVNATQVRQWQRQASLVCRVPELRGHDAQVLVACGVETPERLAAFSTEDLAELVLPFVKTKQGRRLLRNGKEPDTGELTHWIQWARHARHLAAA